MVEASFLGYHAFKKNDWLLVIVNFVNIQKKRERKKLSTCIYLCTWEG